MKNMLKISQDLFFTVLFVWVVAVNSDAQPTDIQISLTTLRSDLDLILKDNLSPVTINIQYAPFAVLHLSVLPNLPGHGKMIKIQGPLMLKQKSVPATEIGDIVYKDGSFGQSMSLDDITYIIPRMVPIPATKNIDYILLADLKKSLNTAIKNLGWPQKNLNLFSSTLEVGPRVTYLKYSPEDDRFIFQQPIKGIALYRGDKFDVGAFVKSGTYTKIKRLMRTSSSRDSLLGGISQLASTKYPDVFFDVWYEPRSGRMGSSSGSFDGIDAVRIYDEWAQDIASSEARGIEERIVSIDQGKRIRERSFEQDMYNAYIKLYHSNTAYMNAIINYADQVVIDVRRGWGEDHSVVASGTTNADALGQGPDNIRAYYDIQKLEYSDTRAARETFTPVKYGQSTWYLKYSDWGTLERHLRATLAAMQGGCKERGKLFYDYQIFSEESIHIRYNCKTGSISLPGGNSVLAEVPKVNEEATIQCNSTYMPTHQVEMVCRRTGAPVLAIRQEPKEMWVRYVEPSSICTAALTPDSVKLQEALVRNQRLRQNTLGAIILDEYLILVMKLTKDVNDNVEVYSQGANIDHRPLNFHGGIFLRKDGTSMASTDVITMLKHHIIGPDVAEQYIIGAKYVTIKKLQQHFKKVSEEAWLRCTSRQLKTFSFMLVYHRRFALHGIYECSEKVFLVEGTFGAFKVSRHGGAEIRMVQELKGFIYSEKAEFFITEGVLAFDVYAISVPEVNLDATKKSHGAPIPLDEHTFILLQSREV